MFAITVRMDNIVIKCKTCYKRILSHSKILTCNLCQCSYHINCISITREEYDHLSQAGSEWFCIQCMESILPCNHPDDDEDFIVMLYDMFAEKPLSPDIVQNMVFNPFKTNDDVRVPLFDVDPDIQFYTDMNYLNIRTSNYYSEDLFNTTISNLGFKHPLSFLHSNIRSLKAHHVELEAYLGMLNFEFSILGISESWLTEVNCDLYPLSDYNLIEQHRESRSGGGVCIFVKSDIPFQERSDLNRNSSVLECIFLEMDKCVFCTNKNIIVGVVYRPPDTNVSDFIDTFGEVLTIINKEKKLGYIMGDFNLDLFKCDNHAPTSEYLDMMYSF